MNVLHPVGIVVFGDYVYWIDRESRNVMKIKKGGGFVDEMPSES